MTELDEQANSPSGQDGLALGKKWISLRTLLIVTVLISLPFVFYFANRAISDARLTVGKKVTESQLISMDSIDHQKWDRLLNQFVDEDGQVDYQSWSKDSQARSELTQYLEKLSFADADAPASNHNRLAFWINAYNALTIHGILREYPTDSIRNHTSRIGGYNIWFDLLLLVDNQEYSLNAIEHDILRKMDEPRIHFAIVCASQSCPRLLNQAYVGKSLEWQLTANARHFFANSNNFKISRGDNRVYLSAILNWFGADFGDNESGVLVAIKPFLDEESAGFIDGNPTIRYLEYDWSLNGK